MNLAGRDIGEGQHDSDATILVAAVVFGLAVPFTLVVIAPTNHRLLDPSLDASSQEAATLLKRWGHLHAVRSVLATTAFLLLLLRAFERDW